MEFDLKTSNFDDPSEAGYALSVSILASLIGIGIMIANFFVAPLWLVVVILLLWYFLACVIQQVWVNTGNQAWYVLDTLFYVGIGGLIMINSVSLGVAWIALLIADGIEALIARRNGRRHVEYRQWIEAESRRVMLVK